MTKRSKTSPRTSPTAAPSASQSPDVRHSKGRRVGSKNKARRKDAFTPTDKQRAQVEVLAAAGVDQKIIADMIGAPSERTMQRYFATELRLGQPKLVGMAVNVIAAALTGADVPWPDKLRAAIYVTKARGDWRERDVVEHMGKNGGPIEAAIDWTKFTDADFEAIERVLRAKGVAPHADAGGPAPRGANGADPTRH